MITVLYIYSSVVICCLLIGCQARYCSNGNRYLDVHEYETDRLIGAKIIVFGILFPLSVLFIVVKYIKPIVKWLPNLAKYAVIFAKHIYGGIKSVFKDAFKPLS